MELNQEERIKLMADKGLSSSEIAVFLGLEKGEVAEVLYPPSRHAVLRGDPDPDAKEVEEPEQEPMPDPDPEEEPKQMMTSETLAGDGDAGDEE